MSMQYQGRATVAGQSIFVSGGELNTTRQPIAPELIWGRGWKVNYATGRLEAGYSINFPMFATYFSTLRTIALTNASRDTFFASTISNGGVQVPFTNGKVESISFEADAMSNSPLTSSLTVTALDGEPQEAAVSPGTPTNTLGSTPIPSYLVVFEATSVAPSNSVLRFSINVNHNPYKLFTLNGDYRAADIQQGMYIVTGSFSFYVGVTGASKTPVTGGNISISAPSINLTIPSYLVQTDSNPLSNPNEKPIRTLSFEALGDATNPPIY